MPRNNFSTARKKFVAEPNAAEEIESAVPAIKDILALHIRDEHKRILIDRLIWLVTEVNDKWSTRFRSEGRLTIAGSKIQHEHVFPRRELVAEIMAHTENCDRILEMQSAVR
jgi:hypothetical protein